MSKPKLFLYKARDAPIIVILRRGIKKTSWELIRWNLVDDSFLEGQWLIGKYMNGKYCQLSPDGKYFSYHYDIYKHHSWVCHSVLSLVPNFTALYFCPEHTGNWDEIEFAENGSIVFSPSRLEKKGNIDLPIVDFSKDIAIVPSAYIKEKKWTDSKGRVITTEEGKLLADGIVLYDTTDHCFIAREPIVL